MLPLSTRIFVLLLAFVALSGIPIRAQDIVYFSSDGSAVTDTRPTDVSDTKVVLTVTRKNNIRDISFSRSRIALAFAKTGNFLVMSELATSAAQAKAQLQAFLAAPARTKPYDFLIKASPFRLIRARIAYENETIVNYTTLGGAVASISQAELAVILYQDGRHRLIAPVGEAISVLIKARAAVNDTSSTVSPMAAETPPDEHPDSLYRGITQLTEFTDSTTLPANTSDGTVPDPTLSVAQKELYRQQSLARVDEFVSYLSVITDQSIDSEVRDKALDSASRLFLPESTIEVTSARRPGVRRYSVRLYLTRLKLLPYLSARIDWVQTQFVDDLTANPDGTYSGIVTGQQTFSGYGANGQPAYTDITPKSVRVRLNHPTQTPSEPLRWKVLLGNIRVAAD